MTIPKYLISSVLLLSFLFSQVSAIGMKDQNLLACENFKLAVAIGSSNDVEVKVIGAQGKVRFFLIDSSERLINKSDIFSGKFTGLTPGNYKLIATDLSGCSKETEFTLRWNYFLNWIKE